ncbi:MAG: calcium-binding protein [Caulobacteraceae bacterium]|nr:MAG: calcium-binding protein [Caulobacteraceae bacterium]
MASVLFTNGLNIARSLAVLRTFDLIRYSTDSSLGVTLTLTDAGTIDLSSQLGLVGATIYAHVGGSRITTGRGADRLIGNNGDDILDGGLGSNLLVGGKGNDRYVVNSSGDTIVEALNQGYDTILLSGVTLYTMPANVEALVVVGDAHAEVHGNALGNSITGGASSFNVLYGEGGDDILTSVGFLDVLRGGIGDDTYDLTGEALAGVVEAANEGFDTVLVSRTITAGFANVERVILTGSRAADMTGSDANDILIGNSATNVFDGGRGDDTLDGGGGIDTARYFQRYVPGMVTHVGGVTTVVAALAQQGTDTLTNIEFLRFTGGVYDVLAQRFVTDNPGVVLTGTGAANAFSPTAPASFRTTSGEDTITGLDGADTIDGGAGADVMIGGLGDDIYFVDAMETGVGANALPGDQVIELAGQGNDLVLARVNGVVLADNVERLTLLEGVVSGSGNALANVITGNSGANELFGLDGNDTLDGMGGADRMVGGAGDDTYTFDNEGDPPSAATPA